MSQILVKNLMAMDIYPNFICSVPTTDGFKLYRVRVPFGAGLVSVGPSAIVQIQAYFNRILPGNDFSVSHRGDWENIADTNGYVPHPFEDRRVLFHDLQIIDGGITDRNLDKIERSENSLTQFMYLMLRDQVPFGKIEKVLSMMTDKPVEYSEETIARYARDLARKILK
jgi:hypothetical protein